MKAHIQYEIQHQRGAPNGEIAKFYHRNCKGTLNVPYSTWHHFAELLFFGDEPTGKCNSCQHQVTILPEHNAWRISWYEGEDYS